MDPSPLNMLERYNDSKSTVSSSDTDINSAGYASSSGATTPEDDTQTFHLGPTLKCDLADRPKYVPQDKLSILTKPHNLSSAMKKMKKVAHALVAFRRKRPDDISPILISSPLRERFGKRMSVKSDPDKNFYSLPNRRFSLSDATPAPMEKQSEATVARKFGTISGSMFVNGMLLKRQRSGLRMPSFSNDSSNAALLSLSPAFLSRPTSSTPETPLQTRHVDSAVSTVRTILVWTLRILLFVPWCAAVGCALLLFPRDVELVAFHSGYLPSPTGVRRFAHWAECGQQHVMIFLAFLVVVVWYNRALGLSLTCIVVTRLLVVWRGFELDRSIPLGEDDQQSLYLVVTGLSQASKDGLFSMMGPMGGQIMVG